MRNEILELFKTKRKNLYKSNSGIWDLISNITKETKAINEPLAKEITQEFIKEMFESLVKAGKIKEGENPKIGKIYRTV